MTTTSGGTPGGNAPVNGLSMYYEIHGAGRPLVLLHGGLSGIGTSFGTVLPSLAQTAPLDDRAVSRRPHVRDHVMV
jgi:pimeloyl-ACP methyl ester carboxylesterase